jgi:DNA invertase Pin-like site-specific DNA recombinase
VGKTVAYIRVSSKEQNLDRQKDEMLKLEIPDKYIYEDKSTGSDFDRIGYQYMKKSLEPTDTLVIKSLDRLGRNQKEVKAEWEWFKNNEINIRVLDMPILNRTYNENNEIDKSINELIRNLVFEIITWTDQEQRRRIKASQKEGIAAAKRAGKHLGRPKFTFNSLTDENKTKFNELYSKWKNNEITAVTFMREMDLKKNTFYKLIKEYESD